MAVIYSRKCYFTVDVYKKIDKVLKKKDILQKDFAEQIGASASTISKWKTGERDIGIDTLRHIAKVLQMPMDFFLNDDNNEYYIANLDATIPNLKTNTFETMTVKEESYIGPYRKKVVLPKNVIACTSDIFIPPYGDSIIIERIYDIQDFFDKNEDIYDKDSNILTRFIIIFDGKIYTNCTYVGKNAYKNSHYFKNDENIIEIEDDNIKKCVAVYIRKAIIIE